MKTLLLTFIILSAPQFLSAQSYELYKVDNIEAAVKYEYSYNKDNIIAVYSDGPNCINIEITKNGKHFFSLKKNSKGKSIVAFANGKFRRLSSTPLTAFQDDVLDLLYQINNDQQTYPPNTSYVGSGGFKGSGGIPSKLGAHDWNAADGTDDCTQTEPCSCDSGETIWVTCPCSKNPGCIIRRKVTAQGYLQNYCGGSCN